MGNAILIIAAALTFCLCSSIAGEFEIRREAVVKTLQDNILTNLDSDIKGQEREKLLAQLPSLSKEIESVANKHLPEILIGRSERAVKEAIGISFGFRNAFEDELKLRIERRILGIKYQLKFQLLIPSMSESMEKKLKNDARTIADSLRKSLKDIAGDIFSDLDIEKHYKYFIENCDYKILDENSPSMKVPMDESQIKRFNAEFERFLREEKPAIEERLRRINDLRPAIQLEFRDEAKRRFLDELFDRSIEKLFVATTDPELKKIEFGDILPEYKEVKDRLFQLIKSRPRPEAPFPPPLPPLLPKKTSPPARVQKTDPNGEKPKQPEVKNSTPTVTPETTVASIDKEQVAPVEVRDASFKWTRIVAILTFIVSFGLLLYWLKLRKDS